MPATQAAQKDPVIVVLQLTRGNDHLNTVIPYNNPIYRDNRKAVGIPDNQIMHLDKDYGIPHYMAPLKQFWDDNKLAILHGVGWKELPGSYFRAMDIWHTCEPVKVGTEGWLGRVAREFDPKKKTWSPPSASGQVCHAHWRCRACRWRASAGRWKNMAFCRPSRASSASRSSSALRRCTNRRSAPARSWITWPTPVSICRRARTF